AASPPAAAAPDAAAAAHRGLVLLSGAHREPVGSHASGLKGPARALYWTLIAATAATRVAVAVSNSRSLVTSGLYPDDAFYYLKIAQNAAAGHGLSFDGTAPTNGFHPLY